MPFYGGQKQPNGNVALANSAEPYFLKQHYKDQLSFLERDSNEGANICNVWVYNFEHELAKINKLLKKYTFVAMVSFQNFCRPLAAPQPRFRS